MRSFAAMDPAPQYTLVPLFRRARGPPTALSAYRERVPLPIPLHLPISPPCPLGVACRTLRRLSWSCSAALTRNSVSSSLRSSCRRLSILPLPALPAPALPRAAQRDDLTAWRHEARGAILLESRSQRVLLRLTSHPLVEMLESPPPVRILLMHLGKSPKGRASASPSMRIYSATDTPTVAHGDYRGHT